MEPSDDTIEIPRQCGQCYHWRKVDKAPGVNGSDEKAEMGLCFCYPPSVHLVQQMNAITGQANPGTMNLRPALPNTTPACGEWCPNNSDPFEDMELPEGLG